MIKFNWDLPFQIPLIPGAYESNIRGVIIEYVHALKEQEQFDLRLGGISGSFGLQRDNLGILRFSQLEITLNDSSERQIVGAFGPELKWFSDHNEQLFLRQLALLLCNHFLNKIRLVIGSTDVRPVREGDLAHLTYQNADQHAKIRLYGGGITLPISGLSTEKDKFLIEELADPGDPLPFELDSLDAIRAGRDGLPREAEVLATGALESALDHYLSRLWRKSLSPSERVPQAVSTLGLQASKKSPKYFTVEDVLRDAGVRKKFEQFAETYKVDDRTRVRIERAIDSRNLVVHGGVTLPPSFAERHAESVRSFLHRYLKPALDQIAESPSKLEFLYAYEEASNSACPPALERITREYLTNKGLSALLYHDRRGDEGISSDHLGSTMVVRVPFNNQEFTPQLISLSLARMIVHFGERSRGIFAEAQVPEHLPFDDLYRGWSVVASEINKTVWDIAIDHVLREFDFAKEIDADIQARANELTEFYLHSYTTPITGEVRDLVEFMRLARILSALSPEARGSIIAASVHSSPRITQMATSVLPFLDAVNFDQPDSMLAALVHLHDAEWRILASVVIHDPRTGKRFGSGLNPQP